MIKDRQVKRLWHVLSSGKTMAQAADKADNCSWTSDQISANGSSRIRHVRSAATSLGSRPSLLYFLAVFSSMRGAPRLWVLDGNSNCRSRERVVVAEHEEDLRLFAALFRGEHMLHGIRNQDLRCYLFGETRDPAIRRRQANKVSRLFRRLHVHGLVAKIPRTRRWRLTQRGTLLITVFLKSHYERYPELIAAFAA